MTTGPCPTAGGDRVQRLRALDRSRLPPDGGPDFNRLIFATSPYLLQHAANPVDWYPWGEEAFARARAEDKPLFVSIGYATCHWCHVMEAESFEDEEVAAALGRHCIAIKVDREERPDIDAQYMLAAQLLAGSGGWPLNVFLTPDKAPFFAATYLPKRSRGGAFGLIEIVERIGTLWRNEREKILENSSALTAALVGVALPQPADLLDPQLLEEATQQLVAHYDPEEKGFGRAPKFPMPLNLSFLLRMQQRQPGLPLVRMVEETLQALRRGGICDQLGYGFHRYSVDRRWRVPHFEKMLYDQALLASAAIETFQATADPRYRRFAAEIFVYLGRDLAAAEGGFYAAEDADSEGAEGTFYLWTPEQLRACLDHREAETVAALFGVTAEGNFEGKNILHLPLAADAFAQRHGLAPEALATDLEDWRQKLLALRALRPRPFRDEKLVTAWNGLAIAALAKGFAACGEVHWRQMAEAAVAAVRQYLFTTQGRLLRSSCGKQGVIPGFLEDYAGYVWGLIELHQATLNADYLEESLRLSREMLRLFAAPAGGLFETGSDAEQLPIRMQNAGDGVTPSGVSLAALNLVRLGCISDNAELRAAGEGVLRAYMGSVATQPAAYLGMLCALDFSCGPQLELTLHGGSMLQREAILRSLGRRFLPGLVLRSGGATGPLRIEPCFAGACRAAVTSVEALEVLLDELIPRPAAL